jgi:hypothetical protein
MALLLLPVYLHDFFAWTEFKCIVTDLTLIFTVVSELSVIFVSYVEDEMFRVRGDNTSSGI